MGFIWKFNQLLWDVRFPFAHWFRCDELPLVLFSAVDYCGAQIHSWPIGSTGYSHLCRHWKVGTRPQGVIRWIRQNSGAVFRWFGCGLGDKQAVEELHGLFFAYMAHRYGHLRNCCFGGPASEVDRGPGERDTIRAGFGRIFCAGNAGLAIYV